VKAATTTARCRIALAAFSARHAPPANGKDGSSSPTAMPNPTAAVPNSEGLPIDSDLFKAALERAAKTWKTYATAICILNLTFMIDALSGLSFFRGGKPIDLAGFKVVREALSATYGILFTVFVATVFLESRLLRARFSVSGASTPGARSVLDLWLLSPFSDSPRLRKVFWFLFINGFLFLAAFSFVHLAFLFPPDPCRMWPAAYVAIGAFDLILLFPCAWFAYRTYQNLQGVRSMLSQALKDGRG
jgi:hypothetical protein